MHDITASGQPEENPFAAPATGEKAFQRTEVDEPVDYEADRRKHLGREANLKTIGSLTILGGVIYLASAVMMVLDAMSRGGAARPGAENPQNPLILMVGMGVLFLGLGALSFWGGVLLRRLHPTGQVVCTVLSFLSLNPLMIPLLYLLLSRPSPRIFRADYREAVVPATPHIKCRISLLLKCLVGLPLGLILVLLVVYKIMELAFR